MSLPLTTTTITIGRVIDDTNDPDEPPLEITSATGIPAVIAAPSGSDLVDGGSRERVDAILLVDPDVDVRHEDIVVDELAEVPAVGWREGYRVTWVRKRTGLGLDHLKAGLLSIRGAADV